MTDAQASQTDIAQMSSGDLTEKIMASGHDEFTKLMQALTVLQINIKRCTEFTTTSKYEFQALKRHRYPLSWRHAIHDQKSRSDGRLAQENRC